VVDEHSLRSKKNSSAVATINNEQPSVVFRQMSSSRQSSETNMDNVNLDDAGSPRANEPHIRGKQFQNGEVIVTLLPVNERLPWVTPAKFRPELVPEELMAPVLTLTVEDYVQTMEKLTTDMRFTVYNICYKRILVIWIVTAFVILLSLLFSGFQGIELFACGVAWLILNAGAIFLCMWIKIRVRAPPTPTSLSHILFIKILYSITAQQTHGKMHVPGEQFADQAQFVAWSRRPGKTLMP
jgi:hypothetical protein